MPFSTCNVLGINGKCTPSDLPPYTTVYGYFQKWQRKGIWQLLHDQVRHQLRQDLGRDKQSTEANCRFSVGQNNGKKGEVYGFDGGKKVKGRKRHIS